MTPMPAMSEQASQPRAMLDAGVPEPTAPASSAASRNYFLTGLILVGPVSITICLTWWFINWVDDLVRPFIPVATGPRPICRSRCRASA